MSKTNELIYSVIAISFLVLIFIFAFTWIVFDFSNSPNSLKDTWSIIGSIFGGVATIATAVIAKIIYDGWKNEYNKNIEKEFIIKVLTSLENCHFNLLPIVSELEEIVGSAQKGINVINTYMPPFEIDKTKIEITSQNIILLEKLTLNTDISSEFSAYRESFVLLMNQTTFYYRLYSADVDEFVATGKSELGSLFTFRCNIDSPNPYLKKISTYKGHYETLNNSLLELIKA